MKNKCPRCNEELKDDHGIIRCHICHFYMRGQRFKEITASMSQKEVVGKIGDDSNNGDIF